MFDWNNHKAMPKERLYEEFVKLLLVEMDKDKELPLVNKIGVFRHLKPHRRVLLRNEWNKHKLEQLNNERRENIEKIEKIFRHYLTPHIIHDFEKMDEMDEKFENDGTLDIDLMKNIQEVAMTYIIFGDVHHVMQRLFWQGDPNRNRHDDNFEKKKQELIEMLSDANKHDPQIESVRDIKTPENRLSAGDYFKLMKYKWYLMYEHIGVNRTRSEKIIKAYTQKIKHLKSLNEDDRRLELAKILAWDCHIEKQDPKFRKYATSLYEKVYGLAHNPGLGKDID